MVIVRQRCQKFACAIAIHFYRKLVNHLPLRSTHKLRMADIESLCKPTTRPLCAGGAPCFVSATRQWCTNSGPTGKLKIYHVTHHQTVGLPGSSLRPLILQHGPRAEQVCVQLSYRLRRAHRPTLARQALHATATRFLSLRNFLRRKGMCETEVNKFYGTPVRSYHAAMAHQFGLFYAHQKQLKK